MTYREPTLERRAHLARRAATEPLEDAEREAIEAEIAAGDHSRRAEARRHLPLVASARVASPCPESWEAMNGDGAVRSCSRCEREVFDLGLMTLAAAERFVRERAGEQTCVRLHRRSDGTMMFADCEVGVRGVRMRQVGVALASIAIGASALAAIAQTDASCSTRSHAPVDDAYLARLANLPPPVTIMGDMRLPPSPVDSPNSPPIGEPGYILTTPPR